MYRTIVLAILLTLLAAHVCARNSRAIDSQLQNLSPSSDSWPATDDSPFPLERLPPIEFDDSSLGAEEFATDPPAKSNWGNPAEGERAPFKADAFWIPARPVLHQPGELGLGSQQLSLGFPIRIEESSIWLALGSVKRLEISTDLPWPDSGGPIPEELWDISFGTMHIRELSNGWKAGGMLRIGSPSDQPFGAVRDLTVMMLGCVTIPRDRDAWSFSLFYSPTSQVVFPIPGFAYVWRPNDRLQANLGIPFSLDYRPTEKLAFTASYRPLNNIELLVRQSLTAEWSLFGGYRTTSDAYLLSDRHRDQDRTYFFDQRVELGLRRQLSRGWSLDVSAGYVFDRRIFQAESFSGSRQNEVEIEPGLAGSVQILWTR